MKTVAVVLIAVQQSNDDDDDNNGGDESKEEQAGEDEPNPWTMTLADRAVYDKVMMYINESVYGSQHPFSTVLNRGGLYPVVVNIRG